MLYCFISLLTGMMQLISSVIGFVFSDVFTFVTCAIVGWITYYLSRFYVKVWSLPKGPTPWPLVGNILNLRGTKCNIVITLTEMAKEYGPVFTFWIATMPMVIVSDLELSKEAFKKSEFAGRVKGGPFELLKGKNNDRSDIVFDQYGHRWESNRRVAHAAVRKYAVSDKLPILVCDVIDEVVNDIIQKEGTGKPFDPEVYVRSIFYMILASSAFGKRYSMDDPEITKIRQLQDVLQDPKSSLLVTLPFLRMFNKKLVEKLDNDFLELANIIKGKFDEHLTDFDENQIRDFCDALLLAKREAIAEAKETAQYLTDDNLSLAIFDLFLAGSDTSQFTTRWIILYLASFTEYQKKMRDEIASVIGDRIPVQEDQRECHLVNAFMHEVMRIRTMTSIGVPRKTMVDAKIGDHLLPEGTGVLQNIWSIHHDPKHFPEPDQFKPERFFDSSGHFVTQKPAAFIPFSTGRRVCLGEKLALADLFLVLVNLLQKTSGYSICLEDGPGSADFEMDPDQMFCLPKKYQIVLIKD